MSRYQERYYTPSDWNFKNNPLAGTEWTVLGSKAGSSYIVALTTKGFKCDCTGFTFHGKCKHTTQVVERFDYEE
jgi:hypothetical protein